MKWLALAITEHLADGAMAVVEFEEGALSIDASVISRGLNVEASLVPARIREGKITTLCERGFDEDAGHYRLTFFYENRRFRLVVDEEGNAIQRSTVDFGKQGAISSLMMLNCLNPAVSRSLL